MESSDLVFNAVDDGIPIDGTWVWGFKSPGGGIFFGTCRQPPLGNIDGSGEVDFVFEESGFIWEERCFGGD